MFSYVSWYYKTDNCWLWNEFWELHAYYYALRWKCRTHLEIKWNLRSVSVPKLKEVEVLLCTADINFECELISSSAALVLLLSDNKLEQRSLENMDRGAKRKIGMC